MTGILVFSENLELAQQLLSRARELSGSQGIVCTLVDEKTRAQSLFDYGASKAYLGNLENLESLEASILEVAKRESPDLVFIGSTRRGRELAPRVAASLNAGYVTDCFEIQQVAGGFTAKRFTYSGSAIATEIINGKPVIFIRSR